MNGIGGNWLHLSTRGARIKEKDVMCRAINSIMRRCKERRMPNAAWYRPVYKGSTLVGYIVGQGCYVSSILSADMKPKGVRL